MKKRSIISFILLLSIKCFSQFEMFTSENKHLQNLQQHWNQPYSKSVNNTNIIYQKLFITVDPEIYFVEGEVISYFKITENNISFLEFDANDSLKIISVVYHGQNLKFEHQNDVVHINLPIKMLRNETDSISISYKGVPAENGFGSFITDYHADTAVLWTLSEPYGARDWWVCKQSLDDKIDSIDVYITTPKGYTAVSNGVLISETTIVNEKTAHWKHRYPIAAYLVAIAVSDYKKYTEYFSLPNGDSVMVDNYVYPEWYASASSRTPALRASLELFNQLFIPYPFQNEKYGHTQFGWGGGMEHQTNTFVSDFGFNLLTHEAAHQWFGDYITCSNWKDIWLNEGFATYLNGLAYEHLYPSEIWQNWKMDMITAICSLPNGSVYVDDTTSVSRIFNSRLSYKKGAMLLHQIRWELGDSLFFKALQNYLTDAKLVNAYSCTQDLKQHFENVADTSLTEFFADWFYGQGYPNYQILWNYENDNIEIEINQSTSDLSVDFFEMHIPLKLIGSKQDTTIRVLNSVNHQKIIIPKKSIPFTVLNIVFDPDNWLIVGNSEVYIRTDSSSNEQIIVFPSIAKDEIYVKNVQNSQIKSIKLYNAAGQQFATNCNLYENPVKIPVNTLQQGVYIVKTIVGNKVTVRRFVKE